LPKYKAEQDALTILDKVALARGYLLQGGKLDIERAARAIINDLRKLKFGKIIYEKPDE